MDWLDTFKTQKEQFITVQRGQIGIETYMHDELMYLNDAYKNQVIFFLESCLAELKKKLPEADNGKSANEPKR